MSMLDGRDVAVRHQDRAHADLARAVDVVERPVADEDAPARIGHPDRRHRRPERLRMRLGPSDLTGVDRTVDEVVDPVAHEDLVVPRAGPRGVGEDPDPQRPLPQALQHAERVRIGERRVLPLGGVGHIGGLVVGEAAGREDLREGAATVLDPAAPPDLLLGRVQKGADAFHILGRDQLGRDAPPFPAVPGEPRSEGAAPVEDHRFHRHHATLTGLPHGRLARTATIAACPQRCPPRPRLPPPATRGGSWPSMSRMCCGNAGAPNCRRWAYTGRWRTATTPNRVTSTWSRSPATGAVAPGRARGASTASSSTSAWWRPRST